MLVPALQRGGHAALGGQVLRRARPIAWVAILLLVVTGLYNLSRLPLSALTQTRAGWLLALKLFLVIVALMLTAHRDFGVVARLARQLEGGGDASRGFRTLAMLDRVVILLGAAAIYLGLAVSRAGL